MSEPTQDDTSIVEKKFLKKRNDRKNNLQFWRKPAKKPQPLESQTQS